jgi:hypothetical protein
MIDFLQSIWRNISCRVDAVVHKILYPTHNVKWKDKESICIDEDGTVLCPGDIICKTCNKVFWCRAYDIKR